MSEEWGRSGEWRVGWVRSGGECGVESEEWGRSGEWRVSEWGVVIVEWRVG